MNLPPDSTPLAGKEIHGFRTAGDLDVGKLFEEAQSRWLRPNEVHALLTNCKYLDIQPQPIKRPKSGTLLLFDRKVLRNFRKDGYNWRKKKDGKNVQEAHEKLKIGDEERVHVYYAHSEEDPNFYRRSYWLLDKALERIVLVHYRQVTSEGPSPNLLTLASSEPISYNEYVNHISPPHSDLSGSAVFSEEINSSETQALYRVSGSYPVEGNTQMQSSALNVNDIDALDWVNLVGTPTCTSFDSHKGEQLQFELLNSQDCGSLPSSQGERIYSPEDPIAADNSDACDGANQVTVKDPKSYVNLPQATHLNSDLAGSNETSRFVVSGDLSNEKNFRWNCMDDESLCSLDYLQPDLPSCGKLAQSPIFTVTDFSPEWAYATVETKVLVTGYFNEPYKHLSGSRIHCIFGARCFPAEMVQDGVYRCRTLSHTTDRVDYFLSLDGNTPISQVMSFEYLPVPSLQSNCGFNSSEEGHDELKKNEELKNVNEVHKRLAHLLFSTTDIISTLSSKIQPRSLKEAKKYASISSPLVEKDWQRLLNRNTEVSVMEDFLEVLLKNKLQEWLLHKVAEGCKITARDSQGQGVIHLCAILDYAWAIRLFLLSGISLDFRDAYGWTALHWAAYYGREKTVAALLSAGANPSLVTDPSPSNPGGLIAADLASIGGHEGLAAYLAEKGLTAHVQAMSESGNITSSASSTSNNVASAAVAYSENLSEQELCLKESLAAYRNAADAADRIQAAFRERALKQQTKAVQLLNPVIDPTEIVAALKIQHAFRNYNRRRTMKAAARIQSHFRTWQTRRNFLNLRKQVIKIQAAFRGLQVRRQYRKITWSVGVLEKAILRWRLKRKGLRGIQSDTPPAMNVDSEQEDAVAEEDFFRVGREQAEERVKGSVIKVQAMFRSYRAQQEYRRMKLAHEKAELEFSLDGGDEEP